MSGECSRSRFQPSQGTILKIYIEVPAEHGSSPRGGGGVEPFNVEYLSHTKPRLMLGASCCISSGNLDFLDGNFPVKSGAYVLTSSCSNSNPTFISDVPVRIPIAWSILTPVPNLVEVSRALQPVQEDHL